jgi:phosphatidylinositol-3,4,5-trisphosphate-dependent Rac exchanger protein 1
VTFLTEVAAVAKHGVTIQDRTYMMTTYERSFTGKDLTAFLIARNYADSPDQAVRMGQAMVDNNLLGHVLRDHGFKNEDLFYRFASDERP